MQGEWKGVIINLYRPRGDGHIVIRPPQNVRAELDNIRRTSPRRRFAEVPHRPLRVYRAFHPQTFNIHRSDRNRARVTILLLFLRSFRTAIIVAISIPVYHHRDLQHHGLSENVTLNVISLSGLTLAVGLVVDNAVVVLENIFRFREDKYKGDESLGEGRTGSSRGPSLFQRSQLLWFFCPCFLCRALQAFCSANLALTISFALGVSNGCGPHAHTAYDLEVV